MHQARDAREHHLETESGSRPQMSQVRFPRRRGVLGKRIDTQCIHA
jgi:hypothetical protein